MTLAVPPCPVPVPEVIVECGDADGYGERDMQPFIRGMDLAQEYGLIDVQDPHIDQCPGKPHQAESNEPNAE